MFVEKPLNFIFKDIELRSIFRCEESSLDIYHTRYKTIHEILLPRAKEIFKDKHVCATYFPLWGYTKYATEISEILEHAVKPDGNLYADNTKRAWYCMIIDIKTEWDKRIKADRKLSDSSTAVYCTRMSQLESAYINRGQVLNHTLQDVKDNLYKLGDVSLERVLIELFLQVPVRDDFQLKFVWDRNASIDDPKQNYLVFEKGFNTMLVYIQKSKNVSHSKHQKPRWYILTPELTRLVLTYITSLPVVQRRYPFGKGKHYKIFGTALEKMGIKDGPRSINFLRSLVTEAAKKNNNTDEIGEIAYKSLHTVATSVVYEATKIN